MQNRTTSSLPIQTSTSCLQNAAQAPGAGVAYVIVPKSEELAEFILEEERREGEAD